MDNYYSYENDPQGIPSPHYVPVWMNGQTMWVHSSQIKQQFFNPMPTMQQNYMQQPSQYYHNNQMVPNFQPAENFYGQQANSGRYQMQTYYSTYKPPRAQSYQNSYHQNSYYLKENDKYASNGRAIIEKNRETHPRQPLKRFHGKFMGYSSHYKDLDEYHNEPKPEEPDATNNLSIDLGECINSKIFQSSIINDKKVADK